MPADQAQRPAKARNGPSLRTGLTYAAPLMALALAPVAGVDAVVVMLAGITAGLAHWFLAPLTLTLLCLCTGRMISLVNAEKLLDSGDVILWQDLIYAIPNLFDNLGTAWRYIGPSGLLVAAFAAALLLLAWAMEKRYLRRSLWIGFGFSAALLLVYVPGTVLYSLDVASELEQFRQSAKFFAGQRRTPSLARFLHSTTLPAAEFQATSRDPRHFRKLAAALAPNPVPDRVGVAPDIFVILNESQLNPSQFALCADRVDCRMLLYEDDPSGALRGPLKVHTHGWGTWNAEFTLMTGVPYFWFGETGFYSAYTTAPRIRMGLAQHLASLGYRTIAIYPTQKRMLNAAVAYRHYGIQEFYGAEDLDLSLDWCDVPDQLMYDKLLARYRSTRQADSRPIFMVMLTVFNHGPHGEGCMNSRLKQTVGREMTPQNAKIEDYLDRSQAADRAAKVFRKAALAQRGRVLLLFAGDHQPSFEGFARRYPRKMHRRMTADDALMFTNYQFFANYELAPGVAPRQRFRELDISFLASTLLELATLPPGPLFQPNLRLRELCHGRLDSCPPEIIDSYKAHLMQVGFYQ